MQAFEDEALLNNSMLARCFEQLVAALESDGSFSLQGEQGAVVVRLASPLCTPPTLDMILTDASRPREGFILAETLVHNFTTGDMAPPAEPYTSQY